MRASPLLLCVLVAGCQCGGGVQQVDPGFLASPLTLDFGRSLEGTRVTRTVNLSADSRVEVTVAAATSTPFSSPTTVRVPGSSSVELPVVFTAGNGAASGVLTLTSGLKTVTITLTGEGVRPPTCTPSGPCVRSAWSLEEGRCVETRVADGAVCDPGSLCLEQGRCRAGACLGVARRCDDNDACTVDGCSTTTGCVHSTITCPEPTSRCERATCDPQAGCGTARRPDGTLCGESNCTRTLVCLEGQCGEVPTADGTPCGQAVACLPIGACQSQQCVRPDAGDWRPTWSAELPGRPTGEAPAMMINATSLFFPLCGLDAGAWDGGECGLASYTSTGFDRFLVPLGDAQRLVHVTARGVLLAGDGGLELRAAGSGAWLERLDVAARPDSLGLTPDGGVVLVREEGRVERWVDGGLQPLGAVGENGALAVEASGALYAWSGGGLLEHLSFRPDGGVRLRAVSLDAGVRSLTTAGGRAVVGLSTVVEVDEQAGVFITALDQGGFDQLLEPGGVLQSSERVAFFTRQCPTPLLACAEAEREAWVSLNDLTTGLRRWALPVAGPGVGVRLVEPALFDAFGVSGFLELGVGALHELTTATTRRVVFQLFLGGQRLLVCPLEDRVVGARAAVFRGQRMFVLAGREDGGFALEAYDLQSLPLHEGDWSAPGGFQGWRRAR